MRNPFPRFVALIALAAPPLAPLQAAEAPIDFNRDIRPIISAACYACHGPDAKAREAELRLDVREEALEERDGVRAIVPGDLEASELVLRITSMDKDEIM
ncbi:MAG: hypothetical protein M3463_13770, partial [Verrucomicrobiota bacterium]|nr:hypothetical protein [Verrucomicrobiota bacterium]